MRAETGSLHLTDVVFSHCMIVLAGLAPLSLPRDGNAVRARACSNACCLPLSLLAVLGLARQITVGALSYSCLSFGGQMMGKPSWAGSSVFRSDRCSLGLSFSGGTVGGGEASGRAQE